MISTGHYFVSYLLEGIAYFLYLIGLLIYIIKVDKRLQYKILAIYFLIGLLLLLRILTNKADNNLYYNLLFVVNSMGWGIFYLQTLKSKPQKIFAVIAVLTTLLYYLTKKSVGDHDKLFDSMGYVVSSTGITLLVFMYFHQLLSNVKPDPLSLNIDFWLSCSQLIYNLGAFGIFLSFNHFTLKYFETLHNNSENQDLLTYLWAVHNVLLFLASLLTCVGVLWIVYRRKSTSS